MSCASLNEANRYFDIKITGETCASTEGNCYIDGPYVNVFSPSNENFQESLTNIFNLQERESVEYLDISILILGNKHEIQYRKAVIQGITVNMDGGVDLNVAFSILSCIENARDHFDKRCYYPASIYFKDRVPIDIPKLLKSKSIGISKIENGKYETDIYWSGGGYKSLFVCPNQESKYWPLEGVCFLINSQFYTF